jgi:hydroxyacylglutathione hydrolase
MKPADLAKLLTHRKPPCILDVRSGMEYRTGHIPGALHAPSWRLLLRRVPLPRDLDAPVVVACEHGPRAQLAKALLGLAGYRNVTLLEGHMAGWRRSGLPMDR